MFFKRYRLLVRERSSEPEEKNFKYTDQQFFEEDSIFEDEYHKPSRSGSFFNSDIVSSEFNFLENVTQTGSYL